jgi:lipoate-protein ligase A
MDPGWQVLALQTGSAAVLLDDGMARFESLVDDPVPTLRWYRTTAAAIVLGRGQGDLVLSGVGADVVTRFSGGGAVWLSPDVLSLDVLLPATHPWVSDHVSAVFGRVGTAWATGLRALGIDALSVHDAPSTARRRGTPRERLLAAVCYATRGRGEVLWRGRKLVGLAQRRRRHATMVQCGMLRRWRPGELLTRLGADPGDAEVLHAAVGLDEICADPPSDDAVTAAVTAAFMTAAAEATPRCGTAPVG